MGNAVEDWGPEIPIVDGVRPVWLGDRDSVLWAKGCVRFRHRAAAADLQWGPFYGMPLGPSVDAIKLPRTHWSYLPLSRGFEPWAGGDEAPGDWDGGEVLFREGRLSSKQVWTWRHIGSQTDIIGYRRRGEVAVIPVPDPDIVTIKRMTEAEARDMAKGLFLASGPDAQVCNYSIAVMQHLGLIRPGPTRAQRIATETGLAVADVERVIAAMKEVG